MGKAKQIKNLRKMLKDVINTETVYDRKILGKKTFFLRDASGEKKLAQNGEPIKSTYNTTCLINLTKQYYNKVKKDMFETKNEGLLPPNSAKTSYKAKQAYIRQLARTKFTEDNSVPFRVILEGLKGSCKGLTLEEIMEREG